MTGLALWSIVPSSLETLVYIRSNEVKTTHSLGFFLGPGLPLGLGWPSTVRFRFVPGAGPFRFFTGSPFVAVSPFVTPFGAGVEFDSEATSVDASTLSVGMSFVAGAGVGASGDDGCSSLAGFGWNGFRRAGGRRSMILSEGFLDLSDFEVEVDGERVAVVVFDMVFVDGVDK